MWAELALCSAFSVSNFGKQGVSRMAWKILEPINLGSRICKNRVLMAAHSYGYTSSGLPTSRLVDYVVERAKGGVGLIILGGTSVEVEGEYIENITYNVDDTIIPWYLKISEAVHKYNALILDQLQHPGGQLEAAENVRIVAPSSIPHEYTRGIPVELTTKEIAHITDQFVAAADRAKRGGLDGIEIKGDQGFLVHQFLSPYYNRRTDQYGGSVENRFRFLKEIIVGIRDQVGTDFIIGVRVTGDAMSEGDISIEDAKIICQQIDRLQKVDFVHVNGATNSSFRGYLINHGDSSIAPMNFAHLSKEIRNVVHLPVILASMILHPQEAEHIITTGIADMVAMTRAHIADPQIVEKVQQNRLDDIRPCVLTNQGCVGNHWRGRDVRCIHNPATGREDELGWGTLSSVDKGKRVAVIGGGVAGMEAARVAALRGHSVDLYEKNTHLGGQLLLASKLPYRQGMIEIAHYLERQLKSLRNVQIARGCEISSNDFDTLRNDYDIVLVATGAMPQVPQNYKATDSSRILDLKTVLEGQAPTVHGVAVVDIDWRQNPLGVAELLLQRGHSVTIISSAYFVGQGIDEVSLASYYSRLNGRVAFLPLTDFVDIGADGVVVRDILSNEVRRVKGIEQVVFVAGSTPYRPFSDHAFLDAHSNIHYLGDCTNPRGIPEALLDANRLARRI